MQSFGFKIVDRDRDEIAPIIERAVDEERPIEIGFYFGNPQANDLIDRWFQGRNRRVITHLNHKQFHVFNFDRYPDELATELERAHMIGAGYSIIHIGSGAMTPRPQFRPALFDHLLNNLQRAEELCAPHGHRLHIENTHHDVAFYRQLFSRIAGAGLRHIHFCFDIGHGKLWSTDRLADWISFLKDLQGQGFALHFHLHNNQGLADEHLSFIEAERMGLNEADCYTGELNYFQVLDRIRRWFPDAAKIFEVKSHLAIANLEFVLERLRAGTD